MFKAGDTTSTECRSLSVGHCGYISLTCLRVQPGHLLCSRPKGLSRTPILFDPEDSRTMDDVLVDRGFIVQELPSLFVELEGSRVPSRDPSEMIPARKIPAMECRPLRCCRHSGVEINNWPLGKLCPRIRERRNLAISKRICLSSRLLLVRMDL